MTLGSFFWYSIPRVHLSLERVRRAWRSAGLNVGYLPKSRKPADVAAEACTLTAKLQGFPLVQIENSADRLLYRAEGLNRPSELTFDKELGAFASLDDRLLGVVQRFYEQNSSKLPQHKQRQALRAFLLDHGAENIYGANYFMPRHREDYLQAVGVMVHDLYGGSAEFHAVPAPDDVAQRAYLHAHMSVILGGEMGELAKEVRAMVDLGRQRKWRSDAIQAITKRRDDLIGRTLAMEQILGDDLELGERALMLDAIRDLLLWTSIEPVKA